MVYLHITATQRPAGHPLPHDNIHGPFASEQEAWGFFRKLKLWYPVSMAKATCRLMGHGSSTQHTPRREARAEYS